MPNVLTFLHTGSADAVQDCARHCAETAWTRGFQISIDNLHRYSPALLLEGGCLFLFLGEKGGGELHSDAIPFWFYLQSLNPGSLRHLRYAICSMGNKDDDQFGSLATACHLKLAQLGASRLHPPLLRHWESKLPLHEWILPILSRLSPGRTAKTEALAA